MASLISAGLCYSNCSFCRLHKQKLLNRYKLCTNSKLLCIELVYIINIPFNAILNLYFLAHIDYRISIALYKQYRISIDLTLFRTKVYS